jgi:hypothetical protein
MIIQNRVKSCLRFANIRKALIQDIPDAKIPQLQDFDKESEATISIFQSKSTKKLGKHTRQLVNLSMETFKSDSITKANSTGESASRGTVPAKHSPSLFSTASPIKHSLPSLTSKSPSTSEWMAALDYSSSDDDNL